MAPDLRGRLRRIKEIRGRAGPGVQGGAPRESPVDGLPEIPPVGQKTAGAGGQKPRTAPSGSPGMAPSFGSGWLAVGPLSLKRAVRAEMSTELPAVLPGALPILIPDLIPYGRDWGPPDIRDLLFFDLETTGLSGGAGTTAFLAAFGRLVQDGGAPPSAARLRISQYLLLDYPGEGEFLEAALGEFRPLLSGRPPLVVSYNGKTFDSQIFKTRCLMNGIRPPEYYHADLLHPARRLWKRVLPRCSQGEIETSVLGLDRAGDVPGALAPEIWFSFLKTGETTELLNICDHNARDVAGLAALFAAMTRIAEDPAAAPAAYRVDAENLALRWFAALRGRGGETPEQALAEELLAAAADRAYPRAAALWARELIRRGRAEEGIKRLSGLVRGDAPWGIKAAAYRTLAIDAEWRLRDPQSALEFVDLFLVPENDRLGIRADMQKRRERLLKKISRIPPHKEARPVHGPMDEPGRHCRR